MRAPEQDEIDLSLRAAHLEYRYARAVDQQDMATLDGLVFDDVELIRADGVRRGRGAFFEVYGRLKEHILVSQHAVTNVLAERAPGGNIEVTADFTATIVLADRINLVIGTYRDALREVDGVLRLARKRIVIHRSVPLPASTSTDTGIPALGATA